MAEQANADDRRKRHRSFTHDYDRCHFGWSHQLAISSVAGRYTFYNCIRCHETIERVPFEYGPEDITLEKGE